MKLLKNVSFGMLVFLFMFTTKATAQDAQTEEFQPVFLTVTTLHRSSDPNVDFTDWRKTEEEYYNKVTAKNNLIIGSGYYMHYFTPDDSEILSVSVFNSWEDIEKANEITNKLVMEAWPDEAKRTAFFEKQNSYYATKHSDEIYASMNFSKQVKSDSKEPLIYYIKKNKAGTGGAGYREYFDNVTMKNTFVKGFYTMRHRYGSNSQDLIEVSVYNNLADIEKSFEENGKLEDAHWTDKAKGEEFFKKYAKLFAGHGDAIYRNVPSLQK
ncbi:hypothetical protein [Lutibacter sp.]|uniref:hypothetical protein n=1 Tax=Lutibacter sp. TaxID=1925666 RepID=UPI00356839C3